MNARRRPGAYPRMSQSNPMFTVSQRQMRAMSELIADEFVIRCREFLRSNYPDTTAAPDEELDRLTREAIALGENMRLRNEFSVQRLLALGQEFGFNQATELPTTLRELVFSAAPEEVRLDLLEDHLDPEGEDNEE